VTVPLWFWWAHEAVWFAIVFAAVVVTSRVTRDRVIRAEAALAFSLVRMDDAAYAKAREKAMEDVQAEAVAFHSAVVEAMKRKMDEWGRWKLGGGTFEGFRKANSDPTALVRTAPGLSLDVLPKPLNASARKARDHATDQSYRATPVDGPDDWRGDEVLDAETDRAPGEKT